MAPATAEVLSAKVDPAQIGLLLVGAGVAGAGLTIAFTVPAALGQPLTVMVSEYVPVAAVVAATTDVFCVEAEKPFGPVQL